MSTPTHEDILAIVQKRYPKLDPSSQSSLASSALNVMAEPRWSEMNIHPIVAVKIASHRSRRKSW